MVSSIIPKTEIFRPVKLLISAILLFSYHPGESLAEESDELNEKTGVAEIQVTSADATTNIIELTEVVKILSNSLSLACDLKQSDASKSLSEEITKFERALRAYGYYHAAIDYSISEDGDCWSAQLELDPGQPTIINTVDVQLSGDAVDDPAFNKMIGDISIASGDILSHANYEQLKKRYLSASSKLGYFDGKYRTSELRVDQKNNSATIVLYFESGARYRIDEVIIDQSILDDALFNRYVSVKSGELFDDSKLIDTYKALSSSGYFSDIDVTPNLVERKNEKVSVTVRAQKSKSISYSFGIGAATDTGPRVKFLYRNRLSNSRGHSHLGEISLSPVISNIGFSYRIPDSNPITDYYEINAKGTHEDNDTFVSDTFSLRISRTNRIKNGWLRVLGLEYSYDNYEIGLIDDEINLLRPLIGLSKTQADSPIRTTRGYRLNLELSGASESLLSDTDMIQAIANAKYVYALGSKFRVLGRLDLGFTITDDFDRMPSRLRFFAGGDSSIRGYEYDSLGPKDEEGNVIGGEALLVGSLELDYMFKPAWSIAAFADVGNAFNEDEFDLKVGAGIGIRWQSPIGPIRLDLGIPVDDDDVEESFRIHFTLGPDL